MVLVSTISGNIFENKVDITKRDRSRLTGKKPSVLWFAGLSGTGMSTIANALSKKLYEMGKYTYLLGGDNVSHGLSKELSFTDEDRIQNL